MNKKAEIPHRRANYMKMCQFLEIFFQVKCITKHLGQFHQGLNYLFGMAMNMLEN